MMLLLSTAAIAGEPETTTPPEMSDDRLDFNVPHEMTREAAKERVKQLLDYWAERFGLKSQWDGFRVAMSGQIWGISIKGLLDVGDHEVLAVANDPGSIWRRMARDYVGGKLKKYLHPLYAEP